LNRSEVIVRTNKQTDKQTPLKASTSLRRWVQSTAYMHASI